MIRRIDEGIDINKTLSIPVTCMLPTKKGAVYYENANMVRLHWYNLYQTVVIHNRSLVGNRAFLKFMYMFIFCLNNTFPASCLKPVAPISPHLSFLCSFTLWWSLPAWSKCSNIINYHVEKRPCCCTSPSNLWWRREKWGRITHWFSSRASSYTQTSQMRHPKSKTCHDIHTTRDWEL